MRLTFTLNGEATSIDGIVEDMLLLDLLRDVLGLTGTKRGCETATCGMCSVLVNGALTRACRTPVTDIAGYTVTTIEGMRGPDGELCDLQSAFLEYGAVQCGFCTSAMVLAGEALLRRTLTPSREEIRRAINSILCRCTGYQQIVDAIEATAQRRRHQQDATGGSEA